MNFLCIERFANMREGSTQHTLSCCILMLILWQERNENTWKTQQKIKVQRNSKTMTRNDRMTGGSLSASLVYQGHLHKHPWSPGFALIGATPNSAMLRARYGKRCKSSNAEPDFIYSTYVLCSGWTYLLCHCRDRARISLIEPFRDDLLSR